VSSIDRAAADTHHARRAQHARVTHHGIEPGTADPGFVDPDPVADRDKAYHSGIRFGNEAMDSWGACPALGSAVRS
jgi:hypothetical protein